MIHEKKVIVFVNTKRQCDNVYAQLEDAGYHCTVLHGGRTQDQREVGSGSSLLVHVLLVLCERVLQCLLLIHRAGDQRAQLSLRMFASLSSRPPPPMMSL